MNKIAPLQKQKSLSVNDGLARTISQDSSPTIKVNLSTGDNSPMPVPQVNLNLKPLYEIQTDDVSSESDHDDEEQKDDDELLNF